MTISKILTIEQVAELLNVKPSWIYMRTCDGALRGTGRGRYKPRKGGPPSAHPVDTVERIPYFKFGRLLRFDRDEVLKWVAALHRNGTEPSGNKPEGNSQANENTTLIGGC
jgi:predicted DNA-binding transcriptional regulator AlpA